MQTCFRSLDSGSEQQALDLKRQLQVIEQEAAILRTKTQTLESDNEKLAAENKQLHLQRIKKWPLEAENEAALKSKITLLETKLTDANDKVTRIQNIFPCRWVIIRQGFHSSLLCNNLCCMCPFFLNFLLFYLPTLGHSNLSLIFRKSAYSTTSFIACKGAVSLSMHDMCIQ